MKEKIKVAIVGVGSCASAIVQGVEYYKDADADNIPGIMFGDIGGYHPGDIEFVAAFDVDPRKVGKPLTEAIFAQPNCARVFQPTFDHEGPIVQRGPVLDGVSDYMLSQPEDRGFRISEDDPVNVAEELKKSGAQILLNYLPVGSQSATEFYALESIKAGVSFINCIPVLTINSPEWESRFIEAGIPYVGSDMKSQVGASILSQTLQELAFNRGMNVKFHQQLNVGGNTDFNNMMVQSRLAHKKVSKENVIRAQNDIRGIPVDDDALFAGPSTYIPYLKDNKVAYLTLHLEGFGGAPITIDAKLSVQDSENSAGVVIDAIRFCKVAQELGIIGCLRGPSAFTQKTPPRQLTFEESYHECELLAKRELSTMTARQTDKESAIQFMNDELAKGSMEYLDRVK